MRYFTIFLSLILSFWIITPVLGASISGQVWIDNDNDHLQGAAELGLVGVTVYLFDLNANLLGTDTTINDGSYLFDGLAVGDYRIQFDLSSAPIGLRKTADQNVGFFFDVDSDADVNGLSGEINISNTSNNILDIDLGLQVSPTAIISGMAWEDTDGDNIRGVGDAGLEGVIVSLMDSFGNAIHVDTTGANGQYSFLPAEYGKYVIAFDTQTFPANYNPVTQNVGGDDSIDSDANSMGQTDTLVLSGDLGNVDIGLWNVPLTVTLSGKVWFDGNNNGIYENVEVGIINVFVKLLDTANNEIKLDTTDTNGLYAFENIALGQYFVQFDTSSYSSGYLMANKDVGMDDSIDSDSNPSGKTDTIFVSGNVSAVDMGLYTPPIYGAINGKVWKDSNTDNQFTFGELGLVNIPTYLILSNGDTTMSTFTGSDGKYAFANVLPADYTVAFDLTALPVGSLVVTKDFGSDDSIDSDVDSLGVTDLLTIVAGTTTSFVDMGIWIPSTVVLTKDTIYLEVNKNESLLICLDTTELTGGVVSTQLCSNPVNGTATDFVTNCLTYLPTMNVIGQDSFCVMVCDDLLDCDTTMVYINIKGLLPLMPIAVNDLDTVIQGVPAQLQVISNDTLNAPLLSLKILDYPALGSAEADTFGFIRYIPEPNICDDTVSLRYEICTEFGCSTARATIYLACDNVSIVEGFSPNGDGINESFVIQGISDYPNNKLFIFNRWGNIVLEQEKYDNSWSGYWDDDNTYLPDGTYFYIFDTGTGRKMTGNFEIAR